MGNLALVPAVLPRMGSGMMVEDRLSLGSDRAIKGRNAKSGPRYDGKSSVTEKIIKLLLLAVPLRIGIKC